MSSVTLQQIFVYPVKSLSGISLDSSRLTPRGLENDRRWMIVDSEGRFITQRLYPQLSLLGVSIEGDSIRLIAPDGSGLALPLELDSGQITQARVWRDTVDSIMPGAEYNQWISDFLHMESRFVYMPDTSVRQVDQQYAQSVDDRVSFADGFPFLVISQASLDDLNRRLQSKQEQPVPIQRFRPNLLVQGCAAYAEDGWLTFQISANTFHGVKPCSRCVMTTVDPATGQKGKEPLATLLEYRRRGKQAYFGQNTLLDLQSDNSLSLRAGDVVDIIESA